MIDTLITTPVPEQDRLVAAATDLFAVRGYHATRVSDSVREAGVAQGTFYLVCWLVRSSARSEAPRPPHRGRLILARRGPVSTALAPAFERG